MAETRLLRRRRYEGQFLHGIRHGVGRVRYQNGDVYEGSWHRGLICGAGAFTCSVDKTVFQGNFGLMLTPLPAPVNFETHGPRLRSEHGAPSDWPETETDPPLGLTPIEGLDVSSHPAEHPVYRRHGFLLCGEGSIRWRDGRLFRGGFYGGVPVTAPGLPVPLSAWELELPLLWRQMGADDEYSKTETARRLNLERERERAGKPTRDTYTGGLTFDCVPHGVGRCRYSSGATYDGQWEMGLRHGDGVDVGWPGREEEASPTEAASTWVGPMESGERTGFGQLTLPDGRTYLGECVCGRIEGTGRLMREDRISFHVGAFCNGKPHGRGCVESAGGVRFECTWVEGRREGRGVTISPSGEQCEAVYERDAMVGGGMYLYRRPALPVAAEVSHGALSDGGDAAAAGSVGPAEAGGEGTPVHDAPSTRGAAEARGGAAQAESDVCQGRGRDIGTGGGAAKVGSHVRHGSGRRAGGGGSEGGGAAVVSHAGSHCDVTTDGYLGCSTPAAANAAGTVSAAGAVSEGSAARCVSLSLALPPAEAIVAQARELLRRTAEANERRPSISRGQKGVGDASHIRNGLGDVAHGENGEEDVSHCQDGLGSPTARSSTARAHPHSTPSGSGVAAALALSPTRAAAHASKPAHSGHWGCDGGAGTGGAGTPGFGSIGAGAVLASLKAEERPVRLGLAVRWRPVGAHLAVERGGRVALRLCCGASRCEAHRGGEPNTDRYWVICCATLTVPPVYEWRTGVPVAAPRLESPLSARCVVGEGGPAGRARLRRETTSLRD